MISLGHSPLASVSCGNSIRLRSNRHTSPQFQMSTAKATTTNTSVGGDHRGAARRLPTKAKLVCTHVHRFLLDPILLHPCICTSTLPSVTSLSQSSSYAYSPSSGGMTCSCLHTNLSFPVVCGWRHIVYLLCTLRSPKCTFVS